MFSRCAFPLAALALALAGCTPREEVRPALWEVRAPGGQKAWLFGTIHALSAPVEISSPAFDSAFAEAGRLEMEVAAVDDDAATAQTFAKLAYTSGQPPLNQRIAADLSPTLNALLASKGLAENSFADVETWAAALTLNQALQADLGSDSANGIDRLLKQRNGSRPIGELEGAEAQLRIFDRLAEADQRQLLAEVVRSAKNARAEARKFEQAWKRGDLNFLAEQSDEGLLADPEIRQALLVGRNKAWADRLAPMIVSGDRPFVAVGALHLTGPDGLPALLTARGYAVTRLQ